MVYMGVYKTLGTLIKKPNIKFKFTGPQVSYKIVF